MITDRAIAAIRSAFAHPQPVLVFLAGPNGAGKSTFFRNFLERQLAGRLPFVNADEIGKALREAGGAGSDADYDRLAFSETEELRHSLKLDLDGGQRQDRGFRVFKLAESNFKTWDAEKPRGAEGLAKQLDLHVDHIRDGRTPDDLLYEILLKSGFQLSTPVETLTLAGKAVRSVAEGALFVCLERELTLGLIRAMAEKKPERVVCLDEGFAGNDQLKANAVQIFKSKGVTSFKTV